MDNDQLAAAAKGGDESAFYELMQRHKVQMYKIAFACLGNEADALEAMQEVTYRAYLRIGKLREPKYFGTWIVRILLHYCADERKRRSRRYAAGELLGGKESAYEHNDESAYLDKVLLEAEVSKLVDPYQQVIRLKYYQDLTITEIARRMDHPEGTIKTWLHKALRGLRLRLVKDGERHD
ncbi:sigma-70 family RNA polymerase sigma factor [Paenibacillus caui]|uniref:sigma-70 family RNA polymerase sigma factor n=1 Tax=Paenibacillus caui TaxID=2873927 RepID=UPI001CA84B41|nr:sigma-70 family RNA polymerase sigma factor [Paenibacillus caui]